MNRQETEHVILAGTGYGGRPRRTMTTPATTAPSTRARPTPTDANGGTPPAAESAATYVGTG